MIDDWESDPAIEEALGAMRTAVMRLKNSGICSPQGELRPAEIAFLRHALGHLGTKLRSPALDERLAWVVDLSRARTSFGETARAGAGWRKLGRRLGFHKLMHLERGGGAKAYVVAQAAALDARIWEGPVDALLFAACQHAVHEACSAQFGNLETDYTREFVDRFRGAVRKNVVGVLTGAETKLPDGLFLRFATASMQRERDLQGADLAVVVGVRVAGRPMWRVILLQAKSEESRGRADVGYKGGDQLDEILSTGMGGYLFYPKVVDDRMFIPTVKLAEDVFVNVWSDGRRPRFWIDPCGGHGHTWDLAAFVSLEMSRPDPAGPGRLFPSVDKVMDVLSVGRPRALRPWGALPQKRPDNILVASTDPDLDVLELRPRLLESYEKVETLGVEIPTRRRSTPR